MPSISKISEVNFSLELSKGLKFLVQAVSVGYVIDFYGNVFGPKGKILKPYIRGKIVKYKHFTFNCKGKTYPIRFSRLQAYQKFGDKIFDKKLVARHLNGNSMDDSWDNIELGTYSQNMMDKPLAKRLEHSEKAAKHARKYKSEFLSVLFYDKYNKNMSYKQLKEKYGICLSELSFLFNKSLYSKSYVIQK